MPKPKIFTPEEVQSMRDSLTSFRIPGSYEEGKWMTSYLNRRQEVVGSSAPARVSIRDITLRNIEQMPGVVLDPEDRKRLLANITAVGVPEIQLSMFGRGHTEESIRAEVAAVKTVNPECKVAFTGARSPADVELAARAGCEIVQFGGAPAAGAAPLRIGGAFQSAWEGKDWRKQAVPRSQEEQTDRVLRLIRRCRELGIQAFCAINQLNYASEEYVRDYATTVGREGASGILLADGPSGCGPEVFAFLVRTVKHYAPNCVALVHAHNGFGLAAANSLAGVLAGAEGVEVAVNGYCSATGQADLAHVAVALEALYGIQTGIDLPKLTELARFAEDVVGYHLPANYPLTGREAFNCGGSDTVVQELDVDPLIHWSLEPSVVGNRRFWNITRSTGPFSMWDKLDELGIDVDKSQVEPILRRCWAFIEEHRRPIGEEEIRQIALAIKEEASGESAAR